MASNQMQHQHWHHNLVTICQQTLQLWIQLCLSNSIVHHVQEAHSTLTVTEMNVGHISNVSPNWQFLQFQHENCSHTNLYDFNNLLKSITTWLHKNCVTTDFIQDTRIEYQYNSTVHKNNSATHCKLSLTLGGSCDQGGVNWGFTTLYY